MRCPAPTTREAGYVVTANQKVVGDDYPHFIALDHAPEFRAKRISIRLQALDNATVDDMGSVHAERVSIPAQHYLCRLAGLEADDSLSKMALDILGKWDAATDPDSVAATIYSAFRLHLDRRILRHVFGPLAEDALTETNRGGPAHAARLRAHFFHLMDQNDVSMLPPDSGGWDSMLKTAPRRRREGACIGTWTRIWMVGNGVPCTAPPLGTRCPTSFPKRRPC